MNYDNFVYLSAPVGPSGPMGPMRGGGDMVPPWGPMGPEAPREAPSRRSVGFSFCPVSALQIGVANAGISLHPCVELRGRLQIPH